MHPGCFEGRLQEGTRGGGPGRGRPAVAGATWRLADGHNGEFALLDPLWYPLSRS